MKINGWKLLIVLSLFTPALFHDSKAQETNLEGFYVKISPGALAYYGDLSPANHFVLDRIVTGSKFGGSIAFGQQIYPFLGVEGQFFMGNLYTDAPDNTYFTGSLSELGIAARFEPLKLVKMRSHNWSPYVSAGVGLFAFRSVHRVQGTNLVLLPNFGYQIDGVTNSGFQTAMSIPLSIGISYKVLPFLQIELEHSQRLTNTDLLDCVKGAGTRNDQYSHTSLGLRFSIPDKGEKTRKTKTAENIVPMQPAVKITEPVKVTPPAFNIYVESVLPETINAGQTAEVKLRINKGKYAGPGKLIQTLPEGFTATDVSKSTAFSFADQKVTIDWDKMPSESVINYTFSVKVGDEIKGNQVIEGTFDFDRPDSVDIVHFNNSVFVEGKTPVEVVKAQAPARGNIRPAQTLPGVEYRVQIGAFKENRSAETQLAAKHKITETIQEESVDGWYKYTVGSFRTYNEAAKYRDNFIARFGIASAFVVAYKDGRRLSKITDALK